MEDDETEGTNADSWKISEEKSSSSIPAVSLDSTNGEEEDIQDAEKAKKIEDFNEESFDEEDENIESSNFVFKGFKQETLTHNVHDEKMDISIPEEKEEVKTPESRRDRRIVRGKRGRITEYAQYLGLQPASRLDSLKTGSSTSLPCSSISNEFPGTSEQYQGTSNIDKKFRISRKVYLCAACGTYFENWNLFLHMREIHKRHICLFCLGMFDQAERLSHHLEKKHSVTETPFNSVDEFYQSFKGSCYLICCSCEKVFTETDNFYNHYCPVSLKESKTTSEEEICSNCRQSGSHLSTCKFQIDKNSSSPNSKTKLNYKRLLSQQNRSARLKSSEKGLLSLYQRKLSDMYARKMSLKSQKRPEAENTETKVENNVPIEVNSVNSETVVIPENLEILKPQNSLVKDVEEEKIDTQLSIDTVAETIFKVSKCLDENKMNDTSAEILNDEESKPTISPEIVKEQESEEKKNVEENCSEIVVEQKVDSSAEKLYDSVTDTIMRVSQCKNDQNDSVESDKDNDNNEETSQNRTKNLSENDEADQQVESANSSNNTSTETEENNVNNSFTSNHESHLWERDKNEVDSSSSSEENEDDDDDEDENDEDEDDDNDEKPIVSVSTVTTNDRRLVIKICTKKNSSFRVSAATTAATSNGIGEPSQSEENNNKENNSESESENQTPLDVRPKSPSNLLESSPMNTLDLSSDSPTKQNDISMNQEENLDTKEEKHESISLLPPSDDNPNFSDKKMDTSDGTIIDVVDNKDDINMIKDGIMLAPESVASIDLNVIGTLESTEIVDLLRRCIEAASPICVYCNHAKQIAVNGKQLALHMLSEHNFQPQHPAIIINKSQFITRVKKSINEVESRFFNLDSYDSEMGTYNLPKVRRYECFHCRFTSLIHKEVYLHNRKMHQKTTLICIMCKSTFYSYSELLCHLCPGIYTPTPILENEPAPVTTFYQQPLNDIKFRCCDCPSNIIPSAFRLMVHLRKSHHACDICLESTGNQQKLSNHVWKHKLHHLCYRCGIAYRNKPDITKHLFWKHGTESVVCKKCLQKKWPHIYHFCVPPNTFLCEECNCSFGRAIALKVHKRLHTNEAPHECKVCPEKFISKKLLARHDQDIHNPLPINISMNVNCEKTNEPCLNSINGIDDPESMHVDVDGLDSNKKVPGEFSNTLIPITGNLPLSSSTSSKTTNSPILIKPLKKPEEPVKKVVDVYDLPPLNLSSESDSDSEDETPKKVEEKMEIETTENKETQMEVDNEEKNDDPLKGKDVIVENEVVDATTDDQQQVATIMNGIWDNFKSYTASLGTNNTDDFGLKNEEKIQKKIEEENKNAELTVTLESITADHDYCVVYGDSEIPLEMNVVNDIIINKVMSDVQDWVDYQEHKKKMDAVAEDIAGNMDEHIDIVNEFIAEKNVPLPEEEIVGNESDNEKKKVKSPKKKKKDNTTAGEDGNASSSSSDSSSDSDSSSCSCGTNCSCSSSSSDSSSSSSSSSDSDSSGSESSPKKSSEARRKDRRKEKKPNEVHKRKKEQQEMEVNVDNENRTIDESLNNQTPHIKEESPEEIRIRNQYEEEQRRIIESRKILRESDLDTSESETDEDFYDEHPQQLAYQLLEEKRKKLLQELASPPPPPPPPPTTIEPLPQNSLQNGSVDDSMEVVQQKSNSSRKKVKVKKRKKGTTRESRPVKGVRGARGRKLKYGGGQTIPAPEYPQTVEALKLNIPNSKAYRAKQKIRFSLPNHSTHPQSPIINNYSMNNLAYSTPVQQNDSLSASEAENKRSSKRRRKPKKFYGDSSDEEQQLNEKLMKFRRSDPPLPVTTNLNQTFPAVSQQKIQHIPHPQPYIPSITIKQNFGNAPPTVIQNKIPPQKQANFVVYNNENSGNLPGGGGSVTDSEDANNSSSDSSASETEEPEPQAHPVRQMPKPNENFGAPGPTSGNRTANLYCYCQCPYDEVSEMIACDGSNCKIEWFHFECVGIMVPPKGKWFCPDCKKTDPNAPKNDEY